MGGERELFSAENYTYCKTPLCKGGCEEGFPTGTSGGLPYSPTISTKNKKHLFFPMIWPFLMAMKMLFPVQKQGSLKIVAVG